jgi:3-mercaptopyruvate sulfurtransferase SseA
MKRKAFLTLLLVLPLSLSTWAQPDTLPEGMSKDIRTPEGLRAVVERKDPRFVIVDVRSPEEYAAGHITTAINIPGGVTADIKDPPAKDK